MLLFESVEAFINQAFLLMDFIPLLRNAKKVKERMQYFDSLFCTIAGANTCLCLP